MRVESRRSVACALGRPVPVWWAAAPGHGRDARAAPGGCRLSGRLPPRGAGGDRHFAAYSGEIPSRSARSWEGWGVETRL